jgi:hypothetical protein
MNPTTSVIIDSNNVPFVDRLLSGHEPGISMREAAKLLPRDGRPTGLPVLYRFAKRGLLDVAMLPGGLTTSPQAVRRLVERLNDPDRRQVASQPKGPTPRQATVAAKRAHLSALRELERAGLTGSRKGAA